MLISRDQPGDRSEHQDRDRDRRASGLVQHQTCRQRGRRQDGDDHEERARSVLLSWGEVAGQRVPSALRCAKERGLLNASRVR